MGVVGLYYGLPWVIANWTPQLTTTFINVGLILGIIVSLIFTTGYIQVRINEKNAKKDSVKRY